MSISYIGSANAAGASASFNVDLSSLGLAEGDLVIVATGLYGTSNLNPGVSTSGYTEIADLYSDDTRDMNLSVNWKLMGSTPDSSVTCNGSGSSFNGAVGIAYVLRGVDQATPLDVTSTTATGIDSGVPDAPSITPTTSGAWVIAIGGSVANTSDTAVTPPSGYSNAVYQFSDPNLGVAVAIASKAWTGGAEDPGAWTNWTTATSESWCAVTMAIRPAASAGGQPTSIRSSQIPFGAIGRIGSFGGRW